MLPLGLNQNNALRLGFRLQNPNVCLMMKMLRTLRACVMEKTLQLMIGVFIGILMPRRMVIVYTCSKILNTVNFILFV